MSSKDQEILRLQAELARLQKESLEKDNAILEKDKKIESMQATIDSLQNMMAWFRKKMFGSMSEKNLPLDPSVLEPTLFDMSLSEDEQSALDAEVKRMEEQNAKTIEVKSHKREVRKPMMRNDLPVEDTHIYPEGINLDEYVEIGVETTDRIAIRPAVMYIDRTIRHKFVEALDEDRKHASEALVYIGKLYGIEKEMREAGLDHEAIRNRRTEESYKIIREFENRMNSVSGRFTPKSRMGKALVYTYTLLPRLSRYVLDGRYHLDNNGVENAIRPLAIGRKNYLFCGNYDAAVRAAIVYSLFGSCKAHDVDVRTWLEDTLRRIPTEKNIETLLPCNWQAQPADSRQ